LFDNSTRNKYNPDPKQAVRFGDPTYDDMMIGWISYTIDKQRLRDETADRAEITWSLGFSHFAKQVGD
jgi:hypothetical protein